MIVKLGAVKLQGARTPRDWLASVANCHRDLVVLKLQQGLTLYGVGIDISACVLQVSHVSVHVQDESTEGVVIVVKVFVVDIRNHVQLVLAILPN